MTGVRDFSGDFFSPGDGSKIGNGQLHLSESEIQLVVGGQPLGTWSLDASDVQVSATGGRYSLVLGGDGIDFAPDSASSFASAVGLQTSLVDKVREASASPDTSHDEAVSEVRPDLVFAAGTPRRQCPHCKEMIPADAPVCRYCSRESSPSLAIQPSNAHLKPYYQKVFAKIDENNGRFQASWNWPAFFFGFIWYAVRGMWAKALIIFFAAIVLIPITAGIATLAFWIYFGMVGNYDFYLKERKGTQLW